MRALGLLLLLLAGAALAQPVVTRGGALKKRAYQTYGAMTLYVDPTGSDSSACTGTGTAACATLAGAFSKLPRFIQHNVTINVADGTYTSTVDLNTLQIARNSAISVTGNLVTHTPGSGTSSGALTSATAVSASGPATATDSGQTWGVNELRGRFISFTSGALNGQRYPIYANTATTITYAGTASTPSAGDTYAIVTPGAVFAVGGSTAFRAQFTGEGTLTFTNLSIERSGSGVGYGNSGTVPVVLFNCRVMASAGNSFAINSPGPTTISRSYVEALSASAAAVSVSNASSTISLRVGFSSGGSVIRAVGNSALFISGQVVVAVTFTVLEGTRGLQLTGPVLMTALTSTAAYCTSASTAGLDLGVTPSGTQASSPATVSSNGGVFVSGCTTGISVSSGTRYTVASTLGISTATTGIRTQLGGYVQLLSAPTFTSVTNEYELDGDAYTAAFVEALSPKVLSSSRGSYILRQ